MESALVSCRSDGKSENTPTVLKYQDGTWEDGSAMIVFVTQSSGSEFRVTKPAQILGVHGGPSVIKTKGGRDGSTGVSWLD